MARGRPRKAVVFDRTASIGAPMLAGQVSTVLPADARRQLAEAAEIKDGRERVRALEEAVQRVRQKYPTFFK